MAWLHSWAGLVAGWVLFFIFVTGTLGYFYVEIDRWMRPELPLAGPVLSQQEAAAAADAYLRRTAPDADSWIIRLPNRRDPTMWVAWTEKGNEASERRDYDVAARRFTAPVQPRETGGGYELYRMHWQLHYLPKLLGIVIVGICTMAMFVALMTGVVAHKKIFADFFTFRPSKGQRSWLDLHNLVSVTALPFFVMITFSGLVFYPTVYMPAAVHARYGDAYEQLEGDLYPQFPPPARTGRAEALLPVNQFLAQAALYWGPGAAAALVIHQPGDAAASVVMGRSGKGMVRRDADELLTFEGASGALIRSSSSLRSAPRAVTSALYGLHEGVFAGWTLRWLYFTSGLLGCAMIATGLILWTVKRRSRHDCGERGRFGFRLVDSLNVGTIAGLPGGIGFYFWANRLLPVGLAERAVWEMHCLFMGWGLMLLWATIRPARKAWVEVLALAGLSFAALPLVNALTTSRHLGTTIPAGDWVLASFDLTALGAGLLFLAIAARLHYRARVPAKMKGRHPVPPGVCR
ncbi:PepSY-associated TM helix domain-containing protein [Croceicoccus estronivorus]|uniref:PepSY-associated TM helix domain-containing protein n=1 Tax=Croceicoccus estronivorus TaxID=1172626 RepID=UPI000A85FD34|nr:PepSY-associated TM helix domain-containing protein [Croceicoccus estronivorus]